MSWATHFIEKLKAGETVHFRPRGNSMRGRIESGQVVTVEPLSGRELNKGDIVLCKVNGSQRLDNSQFHLWDLYCNQPIDIL